MRNATAVAVAMLFFAASAVHAAQFTGKDYAYLANVVGTKSVVDDFKLKDAQIAKVHALIVDRKLDEKTRQDEIYKVFADAVDLHAIWCQAHAQDPSCTKR